MTKQDLVNNGYHYSEYNDHWTKSGTNIGFHLDEGVVNWIHESDNYHGINIKPIDNIYGLNLLFSILTGL